MAFDWDEEKNQTNRTKHGVWFEEAQTVWADSAALEFFDPDHSGEELRFIRVGHSAKSMLLLVVFCERDGDVIRIISARKATPNERRDYEEGV